MRSIEGRRRTTASARSASSARSARWQLLTAGVLGTGALGALGAVVAPSPAQGAPVTRVAVAHSAFGSDWPSYHDGAAQGVDQAGTDLSSVRAAWSSPALDGEVYGEPLVEGGRVIVATENDTVYALAAQSGSVLWGAHVGTPVPDTSLPCGDIDPTLGITGTPVVDPVRAEVFAVADQLVNGTIVHSLVGIDLYTGALLLDQAVDPPGSDPAAQLQRTGLVLDDGNVVFGMGGHDGDCSDYHGFVISVPEGGGTQHAFEVDASSGESEGAVWMGGAAPVVDAQGNVWVASGNGSNGSAGDPYDDSDAVLELSPTMTLEQYFAPSQWYADNSSDADLGSMAPALVGTSWVVQAGKSQTAYLLTQGALGGIGAQSASVGGFCGGDPAVAGAAAVSGDDVYVPCRNGLHAVAVGPGTLTSLWQTSNGADNAPVLAGGFLWSIGGSTLYGLDPSTGVSATSFDLGSEANHFPTPTVADGLLLAPTSSGVDAFEGPAGLPPAPVAAPPRPGYWLAGSDGGVFALGGAPFFGSMGGVQLVAPIHAFVATPDGGGYWMAGSDGGVFAFGDAAFFGSMGGHTLNAPIVSMAPSPDGRGYWMVASDGGVFAFGDAAFFGSMGGHPLNAPIVSVMATPDGRGYWLVASDGGVFAFGNAAYLGSMGGHPLNAAVVGAAVPPGGGGYWLVASDGGVFAFGNAGYLGSMGGTRLTRPVVSLLPTSRGGGYWLVASDGGVFAFGNAPFEGSLGASTLNAPIVAIGAPPLL